MKISFAFITVLFCALTARGQNNYTLKLNNLAEITLPGKPTQVAAAGGMVYTVVKDSCMYFAQTAPVESVFAMDKMSEAWLKQIYDSYIGGLLETAPGTLQNKSARQIAGLYGYEFEYRVNNSGPYPIRYQQVLHVNNTLISYGIWFSGGDVTKQKADVNRLYSSLRLMPQAKQPDSNFLSGISTRTIIYIAAACGGILLLILGIAYFYKKSSR